MKWFLTSKKIIQYFYVLLLLSTAFFSDFYLFSVLLHYYKVQLLLIMMGLLCGIGALLTLNSIVERMRRMQTNIYTGMLVYKKFSEILVLCVAGTLMVLPGFITFSAGFVVYVKPVRVLCARVLYKMKKEFVIQFFSVFSLEIMREKS